jgi:hypothetical protein
MPIFIIPLILKGAALAAGYLSSNSQAARGIGNLVTQYMHRHGIKHTLQIGASVLAIIGGVAWTVDRVEDIDDCYKCWQNGDVEGMVKKLARISSKIVGVTGNPLSVIDSGSKLLLESGMSIENVAKFTRDATDLADEIIREMKRRA